MTVSKASKARVPVRETVTSSDPIASFLFDLIRDHVPLGAVEKVITDMERIGPTTAKFEDPDLGRYVISLSQRLRALGGAKKP